MKNLQIVIASVPDRDNLVAEIWLRETMIAEVNSEGGIINLELYPGSKVVLPLNEFLEVLNDAKKIVSEQ
jgi:hypothetical protein